MAYLTRPSVTHTDTSSRTLFNSSCRENASFSSAFSTDPFSRARSPGVSSFAVITHHRDSHPTPNFGGRLHNLEIVPHRR